MDHAANPDVVPDCDAVSGGRAKQFEDGYLLLVDA